MSLLQEKNDHIVFQSGKSIYNFLPSGDIFEFSQNGIMINGYRSTQKDGSINNIWLRVYGDDGVIAHTVPLLGIRSKSKLSKGSNTLIYSGSTEEIDYQVTFYAASDSVWFWNIELTGNHKLVDVLYGQDIGVAQEGSVLDNELYTAQYLDHSVFQTENGYAICSRQNQPQNGNFPFLQQGMILGKAVGYSTDGMQFFGLSYKVTDEPEALFRNLPNEKIQFELSYIALQTEKLRLCGKETVAFYGMFKDTHQDAVMFSENLDALRFNSIKPEQFPSVEACEKPELSGKFGKPYASPLWTEREISSVFPLRKLVELVNGSLLSFFTENHAHVVLQQKELQVERPHGHIITSLINQKQVDNHIITSTNYIYGLFNAQVAVGNTSLHKMVSVARGLLNLQKSAGQRLYVRLDGKYRLLTLPAAYEMGMNYSRWYYSLVDDTLIISSFAAAEKQDIILEVKSLSGKKYDFLLTNQLVLGNNEFEKPVQLRELGTDHTILRLTPDAETLKHIPYPGLHFDVQLPGTPFAWTDDRVFFENPSPHNGTLLVLSIAQSSGFQCVMQGRLEEEEPACVLPYFFENELTRFTDFYSEITCGFHLEKDGAERHRVEKLNEIVWWFSHNALVHYAVPHGLEQSGGAAWGTRDICQGPVEFFTAMQHSSLTRSILLNVFSHQTLETGEWPQWFMFDRYTANAGECHGDIIFWPLKALSDYLNATADDSILTEIMPYTVNNGRQFTTLKETILCHMKRATQSIQKQFLKGTALVSYGGGDWDDTLQPADEQMRKNLSSAWTQALAYQVLHGLSDVLSDADSEYADELKLHSQKVKEAFLEFFIKDGVTAGFVRRNADDGFDLLIHPQDVQTGIQYRLIPLTRSIIAELVSKEQANQNFELIDRNLKFPDGVRLMNRPARYDGGVSHLFRRAEQAANVGREISLQYTHAHIRYLESAAKLGDSRDAWEGLFTVNPIGIKEAVANAMPRQSNVYFSSSDGMFPDRAAYSRGFERLRDGSVGVKGGWRLYSSGAGIYLNQLISNILGIRFAQGDLVIDPVLPASLDGLRFNFRCFHKRVTFEYHIAQHLTGKIHITENGKTVSGVEMKNLYRNSGLRISRDTILNSKGSFHIFLF
jgi:1,2-beta-oligoglucan phosphorylase